MVSHCQKLFTWHLSATSDVCSAGPLHAALLLGLKADSPPTITEKAKRCRL